MRKTAVPPQPTFTLSDGEDVFSVQGFVSRGEAITLTLTLKHDYPDAKIEAGWSIKGRGLDGLVTAVQGRVLTVEE